MSSRGEVSRWQALFRTAGSPVEGGIACPPAEVLWSGLREELRPREARAVVSHIAECPACAEEWRLGMAMRPVPVSSDPPSGVPWRWVGVAATAAAALLAVSVAFLGGRFERLDPADDVYRGHPNRLEASDLRCAPSSCELSWEAGPPGSRYDLRLLDREYDEVVSVHGLEASSYVVPSDRFAGLGSGSRLWWQVTARFPDGRVQVSDTMVLTLD